MTNGGVGTDSTFSAVLQYCSTSVLHDQESMIINRKLATKATEEHHIARRNGIKGVQKTFKLTRTWVRPCVLGYTAHTVQY